MADEDEIPWDQRFAELEEAERFLEYRRMGVGRLNAAVAVGWTPAQLREKMRDDGFAEMESVMLERRVESVEQRVWELATAPKPSRWAVELALFCQASERGWRPPAQRIDVSKTTKVEHNVVVTAVAAVKELMANADIAQLQPGGALDVIEVKPHEDDER